MSESIRTDHHAAHSEVHFRASATVRDVVIGMADGLTVPFALAAGISGAVIALPNGAGLIVAAGIAEIGAGALAMGLGGYLAARSEFDHYFSERAREEEEIVEKPAHERREIVDLMQVYGVTEEECAPLISALERNPRAWRDFMMRFELGLEEPEPSRALTSAVTIGVSYIAGGLIPLVPYMVEHDVHAALQISVAVTLVALFGFGWIKGRFTGVSGVRAGLQTMFIGGLAATAAFILARAVI